MQSFDAIFFDFDGVLVDSEPVHHLCWRQVMDRFGVDLDWPTYQSTLRGHSGQPLLEALCRLRRPPIEYEQVRAHYDFKNDLFRDIVLRNPGSLMSDDVRCLLDELRTFRLAVVSSARRTHVHPILESMGLLHRFETLVCREDVQSLKPSPEPYRTAAARLSVQRPLVVEDSEAGAASGRGAGFEVIMHADYTVLPSLVRKRLVS
ncbi:MAG: HAD family phosphatase [Bryobacterales bacterium]|nr:HAD family phosphatase [Bryobacterales bacterium]